MDTQEKLSQLFRQHGLIRWADLEQWKVHPRYLRQLLQQNKVERVQHGLYRWIETQPSSYEEWVEVAYRVPQGVVCLLSAARFHCLTDFVVGELQMALPNKAWRPQIIFPPVRYFYFSSQSYPFGIEEHFFESGVVRIYSVEKTLADLLRYRNKLGKEIFLQSLKTYLGKPRYNVSRLLQAAQVCRVEDLMREYVTTVLA